VYERAIAYLSKCVDKSDQFLLCAKNFNLLKYFPSVDNFITLSEYCNIDLKLYGVALYSEYCYFEEIYKTVSKTDKSIIRSFRRTY
jgi:hypothetical protein